MSHTVAIEATEVAFEATPGQSLLDAALHAGIDLPYSCRKGVCGNCAGAVAGGEVANLGGPLRNESCGPDQVLLCMCAPRSDLRIRPAAWHRVDPAARKRFTAKVFRNQLAAPDVSVLQLRLPAGQRARFQAGQYLQLALPDGSTRCYSMANPPHENDTLTLHVRHVADGAFSARVPSLAPGDAIEVELPFGAVTLEADADRPIVFVVGGTGFAPAKSILDDMARRRVARPITLIWGARRAEGIYLRPAVAKWQRQWPQDFRFIEALSGETREGAFAGRVDAALRAHCPDLSGHELYCCGSPAMVQSVREAAVQALGLPAARFHADVFVSGPAAGTVPA